MDTYTVVIIAANTLTLSAGGLIALFAHRAFRRSRIQALRVVATGFLLVVAGSALGGLLHLTSEALLAGVAIQTVGTATGLLVILYSLYTASAKSLVGTGVE